MARIRIPKKENHPLLDDNLTRYYHYPLTKFFFLRRLTMALDFIEDRRFDSILEIGFGNGVLLTELAMRANEVYGLDVHDSIPKVEEMAKKENIDVSLTKGSILDLPYKSGFFDCVISIATLEHIKDLPKAISEVKRVLKKDGVALFGFPVENKLSDFLLVLTGSVRVYKKKLKEIHPTSHRAIINETRCQFGNIKVKKFPFFIPIDFSLYCSCISIKKD